MLKPKSYLILQECLERGTKFGIRHYIKYLESSIADLSDDSVVDDMAEKIVSEICGAIDEYFKLEADDIIQ